MSHERKNVELFVGLFLLLGFGVIAAMIVIFGRLGQGMEDRYPLRVRFPNASGLVKGSMVLLSGANIGVVAEAPKLTGDNYQVEVGLLVRDAVQVPRTSTFQIRSSGMLGDSYVDVVPPKQFTAEDFAKPDELIAGRRTGGLDDLTSKGTEMMDTLNRDILTKVSEALDEIKVTTANLNEKLLSDRNLQNVELTFANLKTTTEDFSKTARDLDLVVLRTQEVVDAAKGTMTTIDGAADEMRLALVDLRKTSESARSLLKDAASGDGTLGMLVSDKKTADDLKALIANLRRSGVLFYKNRPIEEPAPRATPAIPRRKR